MEAIFEYEDLSFQNNVKKMDNKMIELMEKDLKNDSVKVKEKKNFIVFLDNIINDGIKIKEEEEILRIASKTEEEGRKMMMKEEISSEEKKIWKELKDSASILELDLINNKNKNNKKSFVKLMEEREELKTEIEKKKRNFISVVYLSKSFSNIEKLHGVNNEIFFCGSWGYETCTVGEEMKKVFFSIFINM